MFVTKTTFVCACFVLAGLINSEGHINIDFRDRGNPTNRIVGGVEVAPHSHPYQVGLYIHTASGKYICGATLLSKTYVLTAAHCLDEAKKIDVILGAHNIYNREEVGQIRITSDEFVQHENWAPSGFLNDIGLVKLPVKVNLTENIKLVELPGLSHVNRTYENATAIAMGWGKTSDEPWGVTEVLQSVNVTIITNERCRESFDIVKDVHMCTSGDDIKGTCMGDSGGPLIVDRVQVGVVSFGSQYCELGLPSAYTRLTRFLKWLSKNTDVQIKP